MVQEQDNSNRSIRSFVRRDSRITSGQKLAIEKYWNDYGVELNDLDLTQLFHRKAPKILDIGSGMGDSTIAMAKAFPNNDYIAVEVHKPGVGSLIRKITENKLNNIRIISHDIIKILEQCIMPASFDSVLIYFPDPWPKKRHHKRRLLNRTFFELLKPVLKKHGRIFIATDWENYAEQILDICDSDAELINIAGTGHTIPRPVWRPETKFERRGEKLGHEVWDFAYALNKS